MQGRRDTSKSISNSYLYKKLVGLDTRGGGRSEQRNSEETGDGVSEEERERLIGLYKQELFEIKGKAFQVHFDVRYFYL